MPRRRANAYLSLPALGVALLASAGPRVDAHSHRASLTPTYAAAAPFNTADVQPMAASRSGSRWIGTWGASPQRAWPTARVAGFDHQTVREVIVASIGGSQVRVRFTNRFGTTPLRIGRASLGVVRSGPKLIGGPLQIMFRGRHSALIPPGVDRLSDPIRVSVAAGEHLAVNVFVPRASGSPTLHALAKQTNYIAPGSRVFDRNARAFTAVTQSWYFVDGLDVRAAQGAIGTVVAFGDSITDGVGSRLDANTRWPDDLQRRLDTRGRASLGVVNAGIGGNRILNAAPCCGEDAVSRFRLDALDVAGVKDVILLEGINDIGMSQATNPLSMPHTVVSAAQIIGGYENIIRQAHAAGVRIFGATLTPFGRARHWTAAGEAKREAVNRWIVTSHRFDGVIDFASAVADPLDPTMLAPRFDSGDHLHPNGRGYRAMARAIPLAMLFGTRAAQ